MSGPFHVQVWGGVKAYFLPLLMKVGRSSPPSPPPPMLLPPCSPFVVHFLTSTVDGIIYYLSSNIQYPLYIECAAAFYRISPKYCWILFIIGGGGVIDISLNNFITYVYEVTKNKYHFKQKHIIVKMETSSFCYTYCSWFFMSFLNHFGLTSKQLSWPNRESTGLILWINKPV